MGELSNFDIDKLFHDEPKYASAISQDKLPDQLPSRFWIINLDHAGSAGTHWTLLFNCFSNRVFYFDPFGAPPPVHVQEAMSRTGKHQDVNHFILQSLNSSVCGEYCCFVAHQLLHGREGHTTQGIVRYYFGNDTATNDKLVRSYYSSLKRGTQLNIPAHHVMQNPPPPTSMSSAPAKKQRKPRATKGEGLAAPGTKLKRAKTSFVRPPPPDIIGGAVSRLKKRRLNRAHKLGMQLHETYKRHNIKLPRKLVHGDGFWSDFADGFRKGFGGVASVAKHIPFGVGSAYGKINDAVQATK